MLSAASIQLAHRRWLSGISIAHCIAARGSKIHDSATGNAMSVDLRATLDRLVNSYGYINSGMRISTYCQLIRSSLRLPAKLTLRWRAQPWVSRLNTLNSPVAMAQTLIRNDLRRVSVTKSRKQCPVLWKFYPMCNLLSKGLP